MARKAIRKGFKEIVVAFERLAAMCKGFKGNVQLLPLCARVSWKCDAMCGYVQRFLRKYSALTIMRKGFIEM